MEKITIILMLSLLYNLSLWGQKKYSQPLANGICTKIIIANFTCKGCANSDKGLSDDIREDVIETLNNFKYCSLLSRERLSEIIKVGEEEISIGSLNQQQRSQLKEYYQAERIMFGSLKIQAVGSVLVTLEIDNLSTGDQEGYKRFTIPEDKFGDYDNRHPLVEQSIVGMLLGAVENPPGKVNPPSGGGEKPISSNLIWMHASNKPSIWKIDQGGNFIKDKVHNIISGWSLVNCYRDKILWRHTSGRISIWTIDTDGNVLKYKEHGPIDGWTALSYSDNKILWRHTSGKISIWTVDDDGNQLNYKDHGPVAGWTALFLAGDNLIWKHTSESISIWKIDNLGNQLSYKDQRPIPDWSLVNCYGNKALWRHTSGKISLWTIDANGNVLKYKDHGPIGGWTAICYSEGKILWRHTSGKVSLWDVDDDGNQLSYKDYDPIEGWTALYFTNKK